MGQGLTGKKYQAYIIMVRYWRKIVAEDVSRKSAIHTIGEKLVKQR